MISQETLIYLTIGSAAGGFINGLAGFGTALFSLGFYLTVMDPEQSVAIVVFLSVISGLPGLWLVRKAVVQEPVRLARFLLPALIGIPLGVATLAYIDTEVLKILMAVFLLIYGGYFSFQSTLPSIERRTPAVDMGVGFAGGVLGGMASLSGALPTIWCSLRTWTKAETRAVLQPYNFVVLMLTGSMLAWRGAYTRETLMLILIAVPSTMIFAQIGLAVFKRLNDQQFRRLLILVTLVAGAILLLRAVLF